MSVVRINNFFLNNSISCNDKKYQNKHNVFIMKRTYEQIRFLHKTTNIKIKSTQFCTRPHNQDSSWFCYMSVSYQSTE